MLRTRSLIFSGCREGGGSESLHSSSSCHSTHSKTQGTSLRENSSSQDQERKGKGGQIRELEALPCVSSSATSGFERFDSTMQVLIVVKYVVDVVQSLSYC